MHEEKRVVAHSTLRRRLLLLSSRVLTGPRCHPSMLTSHHLKGCPRRNCWFRTLASSWHGQDRNVRDGGEGDGVPGRAFQPANLGLRKEDEEQLLSGLVVGTSGQGFQMLKEEDNRNFCDVLSSIFFSLL
ncbi:hypothetical protein ACQJBY_041500 [Aegilops geniculata]